MKSAWCFVGLLAALLVAGCDDESECPEGYSHCDENGMLVECVCVGGDCNEYGDKVLKWKKRSCGQFQCKERNEWYASCDMSCQSGDPDICMDEIRPATCTETDNHQYVNYDICSTYSSTSRCMVNQDKADCSCEKGEPGICISGSPYNCKAVDSTHYAWKNTEGLCFRMEPSKECKVVDDVALCAEK